jgi:hypothetical protein
MKQADYQQLYCNDCRWQQSGFTGCWITDQIHNFADSLPNCPNGFSIMTAVAAENSKQNSRF